LSTNAAGQVSYELKHPFRDGTTHILFTPEDFANPSRNKSKKPTIQTSTETAVDQALHCAPLSWAERLKRVFDIDISVCPLCGGKGRVKGRKTMKSCRTDQSGNGCSAYPFPYVICLQPIQRL
jgi:hypothetical protein